MDDLDVHFDSLFLSPHDCMAIALMHFGPGVNLSFSLVVFSSNDCSEYFVVIRYQLIYLHF